MSAQEAADAAIDAMRKLPADVEITHTCNGLVVEDLEQLATDAMADACFPGNPRKSITIRQSSYSVNYGKLIEFSNANSFAFSLSGPLMRPTPFLLVSGRLLPPVFF